MAMLDSMFNPATFAPQSQQIPGWLQQILQNGGQVQLPPAQPFPDMPGPAASASTDMSAAQRMPMSIAPPEPPPAPQQPAAPQVNAGATPSAQPGFLERLGNGINNNANTLMLLGAGMLSGTGGFGQGLQMAATGAKMDADRRTQAQTTNQAALARNLTYNALVKRGLSPDEAAAASTNPSLLTAMIPQVFGGAKTDDLKEYEFAKSQGYKGSFMDYTAAKRAGAGEYGLQPIYGTDAEGKPTILQLGKGGTAIQSKLPEGVAVSTGVDKIDLGTQFGLLDKRSGQIVGYMPKDVAGKERQEAVGKSQGTSIQSLPAAETSVGNAIETINRIRQHPGLDMGTGATGVLMRRVPGTEAYNFDALNRQAQGQSFMAARESLKGAGQVTDFEGAKGEQAIANLDAAQSKEQYLTALANLERMMKASLDDLRKKAGVGSSQSQSQPAQPANVMRYNPATGQLEPVQ